MKPKRLLFGMTPQRGTADLNYSRGGKVKKTPNSMLTLLEIKTAQLIRRRKNGTLQCSYLEIPISMVMFARSSNTWTPALEGFCVLTITKGLFTWKWGTPGRWGNPPIHIISHFNLITVT